MWWSHFTKKVWKKTKKYFLHKWLANLHGFANICKLSVAQTFEVMQSKICQKVAFRKYLKFSFYKFAKKLIFTVPLVVQISIFCNCAKMLKSLKTLKLRKTMVISNSPPSNQFMKVQWALKVYPAPKVYPFWLKKPLKTFFGTFFLK